MRDRITEVALVKIEQGDVIAKWEKLMGLGTRMKTYEQYTTSVQNQH